MKAQCPNCQAVYNISDAQIPPQGIHGECTRCKKRFFISPESDVEPKAAATPAPKEYLSLDKDGWKETKYTRMYNLIDRYYRSRDESGRYHISSFCMAYKTIDSGGFIKEEVIRLKNELISNQAVLDQARKDNDRRVMSILKEENMRHRAMISIFKYILGISEHFTKQGENVTYNEVLAVLKDVELAHLEV